MIEYEYSLIGFKHTEFNKRPKKQSSWSAITRDVLFEILKDNLDKEKYAYFEITKEPIIDESIGDAQNE